MILLLLILLLLLRDCRIYYSRIERVFEVNYEVSPRFLCSFSPPSFLSSIVYIFRSDDWNGKLEFGGMIYNTD